jgi:manganese efflux pump family protein
VDRNVLSAVDVLFVALVISADNFAAALALGSLGQRRRAWRVALTFGVFGAAAPVVGILLGRTLSAYLQQYAEWIGIGVLAALGTWTLWHARRGSVGERAARRASRGRGLLLLAGGVSVDNLVVGVGLGLHGAATWVVGPAAGAIIVLLSFLGVRLGDHVRDVWEHRAALGAGMLLLVLAAVMALGWI